MLADPGAAGLRAPGPAAFVLVHGAWTGAFVWRRTERSLRTAGHEVFTPDLTGLGARAHLTGPDIGLELHVTDVLGVLRAENLRSVVLVGHSYGGVVAAVAADRCPERIRHLVVLDALLPRNGVSVQELRRHPDSSGDWVAPPAFRDVDPARLAGLLAAARLSLQPARTFREPVTLSGPLERHPFGRSYVRPTGRPPSPPYDRAAGAARCDPAWEYHELAAGHDLMRTHAAELAALLCRVAGSPGHRGDAGPRAPGSSASAGRERGDEGA